MCGHCHGMRCWKGEGNSGWVDVPDAGEYLNEVAQTKALRGLVRGVRLVLGIDADAVGGIANAIHLLAEIGGWG